jgi:histidinol-phosphate aminotransferase
MYPVLIRAAGATPVVVPEQARRVNVDAILSAAGEKTKIVFLTNPGNPTGTMIPLSDIERLADGLPETCILVLDGAYTEYADGYDGGAKLVEMRDNVVMTRTFSKIYGLGGLRVGWGYGPSDIIDVLNRVRGPFNLSTTALAAAEAAMRDRAWVEKCRADNARLRTWLAAALEDKGVPSDTSNANFILARFADQEEAEACDAYLQSQGLIVRKVAGYNLPNCLRITVGDEASCRRVAHAIGQFKEGAR